MNEGFKSLRSNQSETLRKVIELSEQQDVQDKQIQELIKTKQELQQNIILIESKLTELTQRFKEFLES